MNFAIESQLRGLQDSPRKGAHTYSVHDGLKVHDVTKQRAQTYLEQLDEDKANREQAKKELDKIFAEAVDGMDKRELMD